jgi:hypothetical protein
MRDKPGIKPDSIKKICQTTFDPPRWAIEGLVPEGLAVLAGKPKCGKSWLTLDWANQVTMQDESAESLVLALEDSPRRIQYRCAKLGIDRNQRAHILTDTNPMSDVLDPLDGLNQIEPWLEEHPNCRLVVIDTIGRFLPRKKSSRNSDMYADALADFCRLQRFATDHRIALLCITHMKKGEFSPDFIDDALGSVGITATCDCVMSLRRVTRGEAEGVLLITGRDIDDKSIAMEFSDGKWESKGDAKDYTSNKAVAAVYKIIRDTGSMKYSELKNALDLEPGTLKNTLHNMVNGIQGVKYLSYFAVTGTYSTIDLPG